MTIKYIIGDLFDNLPSPVENEKLIYVPHVCNNIPLWGSGFVIGIMNKWPNAKTYHYSIKPELGLNQYDFVQQNVCLINMCAQKGISWGNGKRPLQYASLVKCMTNARNVISNMSSTNVSPEIMTCKFGSKRSGGDWNFIEDLIEEIWEGIPVTVFEYEER